MPRDALFAMGIESSVMSSGVTASGWEADPGCSCWGKIPLESSGTESQA